MKTLIKLAAGTAATLALSGAAQAGCGQSMYCNSASHSGLTAHTGASSLAPLSSYFDGGSSYTSSYSTMSYGGTMSASQAASSYGSGSISSAYSTAPTVYGFSGSTTSVPGLGFGESLQPTSCPVSVDSPAGSRVLGCYSVVRQVAQPVANTSYYRVVRPVVYVRYPVPVAVPYSVYSPCASSVYYSRYGGYGPQGGFGNFRRACR